MHIHKKLTKDVILSMYSQIDIFAKYLNIDTSVILDCINYKLIISSPIRHDPTPSAGFQYNNKNKLKFRDFGGYFWGDVFDLVAYYRKLDINNKHHFMLVLEDIYTVMADTQSSVLDRIEIVKREKHIFTIHIREYGAVDKTYWQPIIYKYDYKKYLTSKYVYPVSSLWIDNQSYPKYEYKSTNPAYAYYMFNDSLGIDNYKIYMPFAVKPDSKFKTNCNVYQNVHTLPKDWDVLIVTKAYKDVISMQSFIDHVDTDLKIAVIAPPFEQYRMTDAEYNYFAERTLCSFGSTKAIISVYDFDYAGLNGSGYLKRKYHIPRFMFKGFGAKDFTDNVIHYGKAYMFEIVVNFIKYLESNV